jgi:hypothetical protein
VGRLHVTIVGAVLVCSGLTGCSSTWDRPFHTMFGSPEDPLHVLRTSPEGGERAAAMMRLKEPIANGGTQADQDEVVEHILGPAATSDTSPVVRAAAIEALARFKDPRAPQLLVAAYHQAPGRSTADVMRPPTPPVSAIQPAAGTGGFRDKLGLSGPSGFAPDTVVMLRSRCLDGLARTQSPEAIDLLARVAEGRPVDGEEPADRDTRLAAVRGLAKVRQKESVVALQKVLVNENGRDNGIAGRAHAGLVDLTGQNLPADPQKWGEIVQAGVTIGPEKSGLDRTVGKLTSFVP